MEFMRRLSKVVNIVPIIAKADTLTLEERDHFKQTVRGVHFLALSVSQVQIEHNDQPLTQIEGVK